MAQKYLYILFICVLPLGAQVLISPVDAMKQTYGDKSTIVKKNILLTKAQAQAVQTEAKVKLDTKIFRTFKATKGTKLLGFGILINKKIRSKNGVVLYFISSDSLLLAIEVIAFNEPLEYLPSKQWNAQFQEIPTTKMLRVSKEIPTITGATLSARALVDGSRLAFAIYNKILKEN